MKDRNVQHASRFRLTKVPGTDDVYDLIPAPGEVYEEGTLINKSALLKDATAALFGLGTDAVPDDALSVLSRFHKELGNEYLWLRNDGTYVNSPDPSAYPPAEPDGYTYTYLGKIGEKVRIETGSYTGTGTYGSSNPNSLTFEFVPRLVFITGMKYSSNVNYDGAYNAGIRGTIIPQFLTSEYTNGCPPYKDNASDSAYTKKSSDGKTITWYNRSDYYQINSPNATYTYIAIG